ncbi:MAG: Sec-independent protein translocase protein TatB [Burkholderiaceae bacterium]
MIDIGFSKIALIGVVALVVIGPEKLPRVARMAGTLFGRAQRYISQVKSEVSREMELDELRKMQKEMHDAATEVQQSIAKNLSQTEQELNSAWSGEDSGLSNPLLATPTPDQMAVKAKDFRKKKMARTSAVPSWYKRQSGHKTRVISGAARVAKYRPAAIARKSSASFHS